MHDGLHLAPSPDISLSQCKVVKGSLEHGLKTTGLLLVALRLLERNKTNLPDQAWMKTLSLRIIFCLVTGSFLQKISIFKPNKPCGTEKHVTVFCTFSVICPSQVGRGWLGAVLKTKEDQATGQQGSSLEAQIRECLSCFSFTPGSAPFMLSIIT